MSLDPIEESQIRFDDFADSNLKDLTHLTFDFETFLHPRSNSLSPSFSLQSLSFDEYDSSSPTLYSFFASPTLQSISNESLLPLSTEHQSDFVELVRLTATTLRQLDVRIRSLPQDLLPVLALCTNLEDLKVLCTAIDLATIIEYLPSVKLTSLTLYAKKIVDFPGVIIDGLEKPSLGRVEKMTFLEHQVLWNAGGRGEELVEELQKKRIKVSFVH